jgi:aminopeptidase N
VTAAARARELETAEPVLVHELAHQWFGDDIAPAEWSDVWLNEGHATWYEAKWADEKFGISFVDRMHAAYVVGNQYRADLDQSLGRRVAICSNCSPTMSRATR